MTLSTEMRVAAAGGPRQSARRAVRAECSYAMLVGAMALFNACAVDAREPNVARDPLDTTVSDAAGDSNRSSAPQTEAPGTSSGSGAAGSNMERAAPPLASNGSPTLEGDGAPGAATPAAPAVTMSSLGPAPTGSTNLFSELLGIPEADVDAKLIQAADRVFGIGTNEPFTPSLGAGFRLYYELPQDPNLAFIWSDDSSDIRSEGMAYGMMIAVQMGLQDQFDRLWNFAQAFLQHPLDDAIGTWRSYFRWQGTVDTTNALNWGVSFAADTGPAPDADAYMAAALYLADQRWKSTGSVNYRREADTITAALLHNTAAMGRTPIIDPLENKVVFFPSGTSAAFSNPSYHLPAFYELFAIHGPASDGVRWRDVAQVSREYLVESANAATGLHPDYANFDGTPNTGGSNHDQFRFDAWRVVMNMAVDYAWFSRDLGLSAQIEKYHTFFGSRLAAGNVLNSQFALDGSGGTGGGASALVATLAAGALGSAAANRATFVQNLWDIQQPTGTYRYYQEVLYMLGLLNVGGRFGYGWPDPSP